MDPFAFAKVAKSVAGLGRTASTNRTALTPEKEGSYAVPDGQVIATLTRFLTAKYSIENAYRSFADRIRGPWRDALVEHMQEHAKEERQAQYDIAMKIVGMGADPMVTVVTVPQCPGSLEAFFKVLAKMELDAICVGRELIEASGQNTSMKVFAENLILVDTQHLDDLRRMSLSYVG